MVSPSRRRRTSVTFAPASTTTCCGAGCSAAGFEVTFIRNVTDIDDKVLVKAQEQGRPFWSIAYANELILAGPTGR